MIYKRYFKKIIDFILSGLGLIMLSPVLTLLIIVIKLDSKGPIFFKQRRIGKNKSEFFILKLRTMKIDAPKDTPTHLLNDAETYITRIGKFLRKTSLDEIPQLINILKGEMSIVGPRPALWNQHDLINERDKYGTNNIKPGLTGWAQVNGRDELEIESKAKLDGYYVENIGLFFDIKIFILTLVSVITSKGVKEGSLNTEK